MRDLASGTNKACGLTVLLYAVLPVPHKHDMVVALPWDVPNSGNHVFREPKTQHPVPTWNVSASY